MSVKRNKEVLRNESTAMIDQALSTTQMTLFITISLSVIIHSILFEFALDYLATLPRCLIELGTPYGFIDKIDRVSTLSSFSAINVENIFDSASRRIRSHRHMHYTSPYS